jgi:hypothetical protein
MAVPEIEGPLSFAFDETLVPLIRPVSGIAVSASIGISENTEVEVFQLAYVRAFFRNA